MTPKKIFGKVLLISVIFSINYGCSALNLQDYNLLINGNNLIYNKKLNIDYSIAGDYTKINNQNNKPLKKSILKINSLIDNNKLKKRNLFYSGRSDDPNHLLFLFTIKKNKLLRDTIFSLYQNLNNKELIFKKIHSNNEYFIYMKYFDSNSFLSLKSDILNISKSINVHNESNKSLPIIFSENRNKNILYQIKLLHEYPFNINKENEWLKFQFLTTLYSNDPSYEKYKSNIKFFQSETSRSLVSKNELITADQLIGKAISKTLDSVIDKISTIASNNKILMLNENHFYPNHRILGSLLLEPLKSNGYKYLALEAIYDTRINQRGFPIMESGIYTREQFFGNFIREAIKKGFEIVGYDSDGIEREQKQAENILKIIKQDENAKIFVYAGFSHINEKTQRIKRMAEYLKENSNIDPISINQTSFIEDNINETLLFDSLSIKKLTNIKPTVDYYLINNIKPNHSSFYTKDKVNNYSFTFNEYKKYKEELVFSIYLNKEYEKFRLNAVPVFLKIINKKEKAVDVVLPLNKYIGILRTAKDEILETRFF